MFGRLPGSQVVDFIVWTPTPVVVNIRGEYWHSMEGVEQIDQLNEYRILKAFNGNVRILNIDLKDTPIESVEDAIKIIEKEIG
jgi:hypothetical protein